MLAEEEEGGRANLGARRVVVDPVAKDLTEGAAIVEGAGVPLMDAKAEDAGETEWLGAGWRTEQVDEDKIVEA
jgi:hypothetical protein